GGVRGRRTIQGGRVTADMTGILRRVRGQRGAVAVEFALILPVLLLIVVGTIEFGRVYSQFQVFNGAAREGARCAAVKSTPFSDCDVQERIDQSAGAYVPDADATVSILCTDLTVGQPVTVSWPQTFDLSIPFWNDVTITRTIEATFRCE
ncbi:MAG: TadE/TadG family type IV pilus assembly protein, partial [Actinomycetota bacterium]